MLTTTLLAGLRTVLTPMVFRCGPGDFDPRELVKYRSIDLSVADTHHQLAREAARQAVVSRPFRLAF